VNNNSTLSKEALIFLEEIIPELAENATYEQEIKELNIQKRNDEKISKEKYNKQVRALRRKHGIPPKEKATIAELIALIGIVLENGKSGTKAIRDYAASANKAPEWIDEIAKPKTGKEFEKALHEHKDNKVILSMKENYIYDERDILNNSVTGALTKLSKQMKVFKIIDDLRSENAILKKNLAAKIEGKDWMAAAQKDRDAGMSLSQIADNYGVSKSAVGKYTSGKK